ncbi:hypothetical protein KSP40_PGU003050 [Platanthera guangdongensis]|uniref:Uncharacterized protein n=1 Tax=Platanthera guangdongensis TaxID=2320717 RepID=A0ABR2LTP6_9ASPA
MGKEWLSGGGDEWRSMRMKRVRSMGLRVREKARWRRREFQEKEVEGMGREGWRRRRSA